MRSNKKDISLWKRLGAYGIDWYIGSLLINIPIYLYNYKLEGSVADLSVERIPYPLNLSLLFISLLIAILYYVIVPIAVFPGQTLGKKITRLVVVDESGTYGGLRTLLLRQFLGIFLVEGIIYPTHPLFTDIFLLLFGVDVSQHTYVIYLVVSLVSVLLLVLKGRAIHDYIGGTWVVDIDYDEESKVKY